MILALLLVPALAGLLVFVVPNGGRRMLLVLAAVSHTVLVGASWSLPNVSAADAWLNLDAPGRLFLTITSALFLASAIYGAGYLSRETRGTHEDFEDGVFFSNAPEAIFTACLLFFLATMTLVCVSQHFGMLWVAIEATTLSSAPLIYFHRHHRSLEATWKYLLICSVGIALALLGNFLLSAAAASANSAAPALTLQAMQQAAAEGRLNILWLKPAFLFLLVGYGTKMGLAPLHTWLPDAHSESPSLVSALLSGALLNCAFLGILRAQQVLAAANEAAFGQELLVGFGLISMGVAAVFIIRQADYKRMLAYSSVEHMGILALGVGLGGAGVFGALLHAVNHSLTKAMLFLVAGNLLAAYRTKSVADVSGALKVVPVSAVLWLAGFLAITGVPPFGLFISEFTILKTALEQQRAGVAIAYLAFLALIFIGMASVVLRMAQGAAPKERVLVAEREPLLAVLPPAALCVVVLMLGVYIPPGVQNALHAAAQALGGQ